MGTDDGFGPEGGAFARGDEDGEAPRVLPLADGGWRAVRRDPGRQRENDVVVGDRGEALRCAALLPRPTALWRGVPGGPAFASAEELACVAARLARGGAAADEHVGFPSIGGLHNVRPVVLKYGFAAAGAAVSYRPKIKLHGENKSIVVWPDGATAGQSKETVLDDHDESGFAAWARANGRLFSPLARPGEPVAVFGEWCGDRLQRKVAVSRVDHRMFAVFAVQIGAYDEGDVGRSVRFVVEPGQIAALLAPLGLPPEVRVLPWADAFAPSIDFHDDGAMLSAAEAMGRDVTAVGAEDPWVKAEFGISGAGEGLVYFPVAGTPFPGTRWAFSTFAFKAKDKAHQVKKSAAPVEVSPERLASAAAFAEAFVTEARLDQALRAGVGGRLENSAIGDFLAWIARDIQKEGGDELAASGLSWKDVARPVQAAAKAWYAGRVAEAAAGAPAP
jgi:hypothetical protein